MKDYTVIAPFVTAVLVAVGYWIYRGGIVCEQSPEPKESIFTIRLRKLARAKSLIASADMFNPRFGSTMTKVITLLQVPSEHDDLDAVIALLESIQPGVIEQ